MNEKIVIMENRTIDEENIKIDKLLQDTRKSHGVLQSELCEATKLTKNHISAVERGISKSSISMLLAYCEKIGIIPNNILGYSEFKLNIRIAGNAKSHRYRTPETHYRYDKTNI